MAIDIRATAKSAGLTDSDIMGKTTSQIIKLINKTLKDHEAEAEVEKTQTYYENAKRLPKLRQTIEPVEVLVFIREDAKAVPTLIVGFIPDTSEYVAYKGDKIYKIAETRIVKSESENIKPASKPQKPAAKKTKTKKNP